MRLLLLAALVTCVGCAGSAVLTPPVQTALRVPSDRTLIVSPLTARETPPVYVHGRYGTIPVTSGFGDDRVRAVDRELRELLAASHVDVEDERDLGGRAPGPGTFLLRLDIAAYRDDVSFAFGDIVACAVGGTFTLGLAALPCITTRNGATQTVEVDARLYAATGARPAAVPVNGHLESSVDVTDRRPLWHRELRVRMEVGYNVFGLGNATFSEEEDLRLAQLIFAQLAPALAEGMTAPVPPDAYAPPPPTPPDGGAPAAAVPPLAAPINAAAFP